MAAYSRMPGCDHTFNGWHGYGKESRLTSDRNWNEPIRWNRMAEERGEPFTVFASTMCDVFDNEVPDEWHERLWSLMEATPWLRWQVLTKNAVGKKLPMRWGDHWPKNVTLVDEFPKKALQ